MITRVAKYASLAVLGVAVFLLSWGLIEPYFIDTEAQTAEIPGLPASWEGQRVGVIADWQFRPAPDGLVPSSLTDEVSM